MSRKSTRLLRGLLAESGYYTFPIAKRFRKGAHDFVLVPKSRSQLPYPFLVAREAFGGTIEVQPYGIAGVHQAVIGVIERARTLYHIPVAWNQKILRPEHESLRLEHFLTPKGLRELKNLCEI